MNPRTIVLSLGAHVVVIAVLVAVKSTPEPRAPTMIRITESKKAAPKSKAPASTPPKPKPKVQPKPKVKPKPRPKSVKRRAKTAPKTRQAPGPTGPAQGAPPRFSGLVLGNANGVGMAVGVTEDVARGPAIATAGGGGGGAQQAAIQPIQPAPPPKPKTQTCARIDRPRIASRQRTIRYAEEARTAGAEGRLVLRLHVSAQGRVTRVVVVKPVHPTLDREAIAAARTWRFEPETRCGRAVASTFVIARRFELTD